MRNMSFMLKAQQYRDGTADVTRRIGWLKLKPGEHFMGVEKAQGLKKGEKVVRIGPSVCVSNRREPLRRMLDDLDYGRQEVVREGFPWMSPRGFVSFFCATHKGCTPETEISRIEYRREHD